MKSRYEKQPAENIDWVFDFSDWLPTGDTIASSTVTADSGITLGAKTATTTEVQQFISGGVHGVRYRVTCSITTAQGRIKEDEIFITVREK